MITRINPPELGTPPGYSQIVEVKAGRIIFIAGQTALDRDGNVVGRHDFAAQVEQVFRNLAIALEASRCTPANLVSSRYSSPTWIISDPIAKPETASLPR